MGFISKAISSVKKTVKDPKRAASLALFGPVNQAVGNTVASKLKPKAKAATPALDYGYGGSAIEDAMDALKRGVNYSPSVGASTGSTVSDTGAIIDLIAQRLPELTGGVFETQLKYLPEQVKSSYDLTKQYSPLYAELALDLQRKYAPSFQEVGLEAAGRERESTLSDVLRLTPELAKIREASEGPEITAMRKMLQGQVFDELASGSRLTPELERQATQGLRASEFSRGLGTGQGSANREAVNRALEGMKLKNLRQTAASQYLAQDQSSRPDPFGAIANSPQLYAPIAMNTATNPGVATPSTMGTDPNAAFNAAMGITNAGLGAANAQAGLTQSNNQFNAQQALNAQQYNITALANLAQIALAKNNAVALGNNVQ